jgi:hypothetical protein
LLLDDNVESEGTKRRSFESAFMSEFSGGSAARPGGRSGRPPRGSGHAHHAFGFPFGFEESKEEMEMDLQESKEEDSGDDDNNSNIEDDDNNQLDNLLTSELAVGTAAAAETQTGTGAESTAELASVQGMCTFIGL